MGLSTPSTASCETVPPCMSMLQSPSPPESARKTRLPKRAKASSSSRAAVFSGSHSPSTAIPRPCLNETSSTKGNPTCSGATDQSTTIDAIEHAVHCQERGLQARRRETIVPSLSHTLSHFSLSQPSSSLIMGRSSPTAGCDSTPPTAGSESTPVTELPGHREFTPGPSQTPLRSPRRRARQFQTPLALQIDHVYPSTAPLPHISAFLGSPFSTKTIRDNSQYDSGLPGQRVQSVPIVQGNIGQMEFDWHDGELPNPDDDELAVKFSSLSNKARRRRDTFSSNSSMDDFSGSGTSSASLLSLGRRSEDLQHATCPVTIWVEEGPSGTMEKEADPATTSRTCYVGDALEVSGKTAQPIPGVTQIVFKAYPTCDRTVHPAPDLPTSFGPEDLRHTPSSTPFRSPEPLMSLVPRLFASADRPIPSSRRTEKSRSPRRPSRMSKQEETRPTVWRQATAGFSMPIRMRDTAGSVNPGSSLALGLGLGIRDDNQSLFSSVNRPLPETIGLSCSLSSESSADFDHSPSKSLSTRITSADPATGSSMLPRRIINQAKHLSGRSSASPEGYWQSPLPTNASNDHSTLRRLTAPSLATVPSYLTPQAALHTPPPALFADIKPSPAAFVSTGLIKKRSGLANPSFAFAVQAEPSTTTASDRVAAVQSPSPVKSNGISFGLEWSPSSLASPRPRSIGANRANSTSTRGSQSGRGLRRKSSQMFTSSASSGGDSQELMTSPATPTKSGPTMVDWKDYSTPSPSTPSDSVYPFTASSILPSSSPASAESVLSRSHRKALPARLRQLSYRGPIARKSNPMLATSFRTHGPEIESVWADSPIRAGKSVLRGRFEDDFQIVQSLGVGAFSQVWKVCEKKTGSMYAVKAGKPFTGFKSRLRQLEELSILRQLSVNPHPHIVDFIDSWEHGVRLYLQTELVECGDLARFLQSVADVGGLGEPRAWKMLAELSAGIQYIHAHEFLHMDIKPSNVLITHAGSLKIADFGLSIVATPGGMAGSLSPALPYVQEDGGFVWEQQKISAPVPSPILDRELEGDRAYLCPEALSNGLFGKEADIYSLGILLLESALNVELPSNGDGWIKLRNEDWSDLNENYRLRGRQSTSSSEGDETAPELSEELLSTIKGMMRSEPNGRMKLDDLEMTAVMTKLRGLQAAGGGMRRSRAALVEEGDWFLTYILGEEVE